MKRILILGVVGMAGFISMAQEREPNENLPFYVDEIKRLPEFEVEDKKEGVKTISWGLNKKKYCF